MTAEVRDPTDAGIDILTDDGSAGLSFHYAYGTLYWSESGGMRPLYQALNEGGAVLGELDLYEAQGLSGDGRFVVGRAAVVEGLPRPAPRLSHGGSNAPISSRRSLAAPRTIGVSCNETKGVVDSDLGARRAPVSARYASAGTSRLGSKGQFVGRCSTRAAAPSHRTRNNARAFRRIQRSSMLGKDLPFVGTD